MKSNSVARLVNGSHVCITDRHFDHTCNIAVTLNALFCASRLLQSCSRIHTITTTTS